MFRKHCIVQNHTVAGHFLGKIRVQSGFRYFKYFYRVNAKSMEPLFLISMPGGSEWILIFLAVLLLFGGKKIPELMRGIGKGIREFNSAKANVQQELEDGMKESDKKDRPE